MEERKMRKLNVLLILCFALAFASIAQGQSNNAALNGNYAFNFTGVSGNGTTGSVFGAVGRFTADGAGNLSNGELATNRTGGGATSPQAFTGTYSTGADNRGVMTLNFSGSSAKLAFAMMANGNAQFIEFDAAGGAGTIGSGTMEKADATAFSTARITGDYAFGAAGFDNGSNRAAIEGRFTSNGTGTLSSAAGDLNGYGTDYPMISTAATYAETFCSAPNSVTGAAGTYSVASIGRAAITIGGYNLVAYLVNTNQIFLFVSDVNVLFGAGEPQAAVSFTNDALKGTYAGYAA